MRLSFPISKVEKQADGSLKVVGVATDESIDSQGDILDYPGSKAAFGGWRGNVREAHDPKKPVGKALNITFNDDAKAIEVEAFISAGAPETQAKLLDGTLGSFSVGGGQPTKVRMEKVGDKMVRRVLEWPMTELSVVDVGANPNANIQLVKADGVATDALATPEPNRLEATLLAALRKGGEVAESAKGDDEAVAEEGGEEEPEKEPADDEGEGEKCGKCMKVHKDGDKDGDKDCSKEDLAAAKTFRAKAEIDAAKAKHKIALAGEALVAARSKIEETKGKATDADGLKKAPVEYDISDAVEILKGVRRLRSIEASENEIEAAQLALLDAADENIRQFIALEASETPTPENGGPLAYSTKTSAAVLLKALLDKVNATPQGDVFKTTHGDQLAEGIGKGLSETAATIAKAQSETKGLIESGFKGLRESVAALAKTAAVPTPLRTAPPAPLAPAGDTINAALASLEAAGNGITHPELRAQWQQSLAIAKALGK